MSQISVSLSCRGPSLHRVNVIQQTAAQPGRSPAAGEVTDRYPLFAVEPASVNHLASIRCRRDGASSFETVLFAKTRHCSAILRVRCTQIISVMRSQDQPPHSLPARFDELAPAIDRQRKCRYLRLGDNTRPRPRCPTDHLQIDASGTTRLIPRVCNFILSWQHSSGSKGPEAGVKKGHPTFVSSLLRTEWQTTTPYRRRREPNIGITQYPYI